MRQDMSLFHSVQMYEERCKGCTVCVTGCPAEAIRVRNGKAHILEERCIDCGECIRRCPSRAKYTGSPALEDLNRYERAAALIPPSFYAQFPDTFSAADISQALKTIGFTYTADVAEDALAISEKAAAYLKSEIDRPHPLISSSCPAVIKLIQIRFPALLPHILPLLPPMEYSARRIRKRFDTDGVRTGIFFISPCPAKITAARTPAGYAQSELDGAFTAAALYLPVLSALKKLPSKAAGPQDTETDGRGGDLSAGTVWCRETGEASCIQRFMGGVPFRWLSASGIEQTAETLEAAEDGQLDNYDFIELAACRGGCVGGPLNVKSVPLAASVIRSRFARQEKTPEKTELQDCISWRDAALDEDIIPRPARQLSANFSQAKKMMEQMEEIASRLPGIDCGSCGAPNCRALAEDIVLGTAIPEDCIVVMKRQYESLLFEKRPPNT